VIEQKVSRRKLSDEILDRLLLMIEQGEVEPGGFLPSERDLMQRFGVGRPAVREALQALAGMGIIQIQHGERARLTSMGPSTVLEQVDRTVRHLLQTSPETRDHLREARLMFETGMVRLAARNATPAQVAQLREALAAQEASAGHPARFVAADMAFHKTIAGMAGNPIYTAVSQAMLQWVFEMFPRLLRVPGTESLTLREHREVLEAIAARDEEGAVRALSTHLLRSNPLYQKRGAKTLKAPRKR
jgi:DNA-binding FadR family transcriptional regulator